MATIIPVAKAGDYRTGGLRNLRPGGIVRVLGFAPNVEDDTEKVSHSWGFTVDGERCGIWSYKGSERAERWSTYGPRNHFEALFGAEHVEP
jgi:hypothetical protein